MLRKTIIHQFCIGSKALNPGILEISPTPGLPKGLKVEISWDFSLTCESLRAMGKKGGGGFDQQTLNLLGFRTSTKKGMATWALLSLCTHQSLDYRYSSGASGPGPHPQWLSFRMTTHFNKVPSHTWESATQQTHAAHIARSVSTNPSGPHVGRRKSRGNGI